MSDFSTVGFGGPTYEDRIDAGMHTWRRAWKRPSTAVVGVVLAGGQGTRLSPLTRHRAKPVVPFSARHRLIDFALSNLVNSGVPSIYVLLQHQSRSVRDHLRSAWHMLPGNGMIRSMQSSDRPFLGTADAVRRSLDRLPVHSADLVMIFGADHVYRMDVRQMMAAHRNRNAEATVAALPVPRQEARAFGVIGCEADGRIASFLEKPDDPPAMPSDPSRAYASMGNYCFSAQALLRVLRDCEDIENLDFGHHVLPRMIAQGRRVYAYDFASNRIPGLAHEDEGGYWRDVGTLDAYFEATLDTLGPRPAFDVDRPEWPIRSTGRAWPEARLLRAELRDARIGQGALVRDARITSSVVRRAARIEEGAELDQCIVLDGARIGKGARLKRAIVDRNAVVAPNTHIGFDRDEDAARWTVTPAGITVVANA